MTHQRPFTDALRAVLQSRSTVIVITRSFIVFQCLVGLITGAIPGLGWILTTLLVFIVLGCPILAACNALLGTEPPTVAAAWCSTRVRFARLAYAAKIGLQTVVLSLVLVFYLDYQHATELFKTLSNDDFKMHVHIMFAFGAVLGWFLSRWRLNRLKPPPVPSTPLLDQSSE